MRGKTLSRAALTFSEPNRGIASWLAAPGPMGALEYISPNANVVGRDSRAVVMDNVLADLDYAIAEKAANLRCVPLGTSWSDVGSWSALWSFLEKNEDGNVVQGHADIMLENVRNSYVYADDVAPLLSSHYRWLISTFWWWLIAWGFIIGALAVVPIAITAAPMTRSSIRARSNAAE